MVAQNCLNNGSLKCLSNFWRTLEMSLIICEVKEISDGNLCVSVATLSN